MGLTIHYDLKTDLTKSQDVRHLVEATRQHALDLPFKEVDEVKEIKGAETGGDDKSDPDRWLKIQSSVFLAQGESYHSVPANHIIALSTWPGEGCEQANFGFCQYPSHVKLPSGKKLATKKDGWSWHSFCKTQYASDPKAGGIEKIGRAHV